MEALQGVDTGSVLLRFEAENVRSFRDSVELSLVATRLSEPDAVRSVVVNERGATLDVLPGAYVLGANASGKSNVLRAMADMRACVLHSFKQGDLESGIPRRPFALDGSAAQPSRLVVDLVIDGVRYEYGFIFDDESFISEWAYSFPRAKRTVLFEREGMAVTLGASLRSQGKVVERLLRPNALFLSAAAAAGTSVLEPLHRWFRRNLVLAEASNRASRHIVAASRMQDEATRRRMLQFVQIADLGISDVKVEEPDPELLKRLQRATMILAGRESEADAGDMEVQFNALGTLRLSHSGALGDVELDASDESLGTLVWLGLLSPLLDALDAGSVLLADELDSSLHPRLVEQVARLFQDPETNPRNAQLIANLFDTSLLGDSVTPRVIGRDQVWLCEKGADGSSALTPLSDFAPRKREDLAGRYLRGRYGGVPLVDHHEFAAALESQR